MKHHALRLAAAGAVAAIGLVLAEGPASSAGAAPSSLPTITLALNGKSVTVGGTPVSGAVQVVSTTSYADASPVLLRLNSGATYQQAAAAAAKAHGDPNAVTPYGSLAFSADAPKGTTTVQTVLQPGNYEAIDTQGNDPAKWPHTSFTVLPAPAPAALPAASQQVNAIDFAFTGSSTLHDGRLTRFQNNGYVVHMIIGVRVKNMAAARRITALLKAGRDGKAQRLGLGFASFQGPVSTGAVQQQVLNVPKGVYVLACFMNTQDGREHTRLGMLRTIRVVK